MRQFVPNPSTPEQIAHRRTMMAKIDAISNWIADHGPVTDSITNEWVMSEIEPMLTDGITIKAEECSNGWHVYSFRYPPFAEPSPEPDPAPVE